MQWICLQFEGKLGIYNEKFMCRNVLLMLETTSVFVSEQNWKAWNHLNLEQTTL